ncbi:hypothetical protein [Sporosalibacterium faouarense]|uniref:hypothetical protein n=1 Tax=Sporosalibacterium faouarense TaxID=516123 RepID=UPI00141D69C0|nr:hypothetical protein [Sporosalibacterium faouarense]MTI49835.1 hypothetical protein [Bacillota bacterium]
MDLIKKWNHKLRQVEQELEDYNDILYNNKLNSDMKYYCISRIKSKKEYKKLIENTIDELLAKEYDKTKH